MKIIKDLTNKIKYLHKHVRLHIPMHIDASLRTCMNYTYTQVQKNTKFNANITNCRN